jgi:hypothetical protein
MGTHTYLRIWCTTVRYTGRGAVSWTNTALDNRLTSGCCDEASRTVPPPPPQPNSKRSYTHTHTATAQWLIGTRHHTAIMPRGWYHCSLLLFPRSRTSFFDKRNNVFVVAGTQHWSILTPGKICRSRFLDAVISTVHRRHHKIPSVHHQVHHYPDDGSMKLLWNVG